MEVSQRSDAWYHRDSSFWRKDKTFLALNGRSTKCLESTVCRFAHIFDKCVSHGVAHEYGRTFTVSYVFLYLVALKVSQCLGLFSQPSFSTPRFCTHSKNSGVESNSHPRQIDNIDNDLDHLVVPRLPL